MRGHHELLEAENLFELLERSRNMRVRFNASDEEILQRLNIPSDAKKARRDDACLGWYLSLALEMEACRLSGRYALCFSDAKRARRHPYDLMARLPLRPHETVAADVPACFLTGLDEAEALEVRCKYTRMLYIQPMRELFERLSELAAAVRAKKATPKEIRRNALEIIRGKNWRKPLPEKEEYGRQTLDLADNNFSIIDRLIEMHRVPLRSQEKLLVPKGMLRRSDSAAVHIAAAVASSPLRGNVLPKDADMTDFAAPAGGHMAMGLYGEGAVSTLFSQVLADQKKRASGSRIIQTRRYCRYQLMRFSVEDLRKLHDAKSCGMAAAAAAIAAIPASEPTGDWQAVAEQLRSLEAAQALPVERCDEGLYLTDNGGNGAYRSLKAYFDAIRMAKQRAAEEETADPDDILRKFLADEALGDHGQERAISRLREVLAECFREKLLIDLRNGQTVEAVLKDSDNYRFRVGVLALAYMCCTGGCAMTLSAEELPAEAERFVAQLRDDLSFRKGFRAFSVAPAAGDAQLQLYTCIEERREPEGQAASVLHAEKVLRRKSEALDGWFAADGTGGGFDTAAFTEYCRRGLLRFRFRRKNVALRPAPFQVKPPHVFTEEDKALQLVLAMFMLRRTLTHCEMQIPLSGTSDATVTDATDRAEAVMQLCRELCELPEIDRNRMIAKVKKRCLSILAGTKPDDAEEVFLLYPGAKNPVRVKR